ncbi:aminotransferase class V [Clostridium sp. CAG:1000]|jgi:cysteine desulfurase|nr:aminotransferase class V [Clostridium sp. CAG:1000]
MIYLDYSATTPVDEGVLDSYVKVTRDYIANANSIHTLGVRSKELLMQATNQIADIFNCHPKELIFTSGASESNTTAVKGVAFKYASRGKHIITSKLEHKSILEVMGFLSSIGYEVSFVNILPNGQIDLKDLESLIRDDTILVSICAVNSETGFKQPLKTIRQIINKKNPNVIFHSDLTQALGKTKFYLSDLDLASFSSHKIYAPKGIGILYKRRDLQIDTLIYGTTENCPFRGGTPALPLIVAFSKAIRLMNDNFDKNVKKCEKLKSELLKGLSKYPIQINSNDLCVPQIVNFSLLKIKSETFVHALEKYEVYVSTTTACSSLEESVVLKAISNGNKDVSTTSIRVSLSHLTSMEDIHDFLNIFDKVWNELLLK